MAEFDEVFPLAVVRVLNYLVNDGLFHFGETGDQFPELIFGNDSNSAIRHALDTVGRVAIEHYLNFADEGALFEVA